MNFILDLILAAVLVLFFIRGWRKGFVVELIDLVGVIAAIAGILVLWGCERLDPGEAK